MLLRKSKMADRNVNKLGTNVYLKKPILLKFMDFSLKFNFLDSKRMKLSYKNTKKPCFFFNLWLYAMHAENGGVASFIDERNDYGGTVVHSGRPTSKIRH